MDSSIIAYPYGSEALMRCFFKAEAVPDVDMALIAYANQTPWTTPVALHEASANSYSRVQLEANTTENSFDTLAIANQASIHTAKILFGKNGYTNSNANGFTPTPPTFSIAGGFASVQSSNEAVGWAMVERGSAVLEGSTNVYMAGVFKTGANYTPIAPSTMRTDIVISPCYAYMRRFPLSAGSTYTPNPYPESLVYNRLAGLLMRTFFGLHTISTPYEFECSLVSEYITAYTTDDATLTEISAANYTRQTLDTANAVISTVNGFTSIEWPAVTFQAANVAQIGGYAISYKEGANSANLANATDVDKVTGKVLAYGMIRAKSANYTTGYYANTTAGFQLEVKPTITLTYGSFS